ALDRARSRDRHDLGAAHTHAPVCPEPHHGVIALPLAAHLLVGLGDVDDVLHAGEPFEARRVDPPVVADEANGGALRARHAASLLSSRTTPGGPRITMGSWRAGTAVYLSAYTSIGSSPQWSGWKCDSTTCVIWCHGRPNCARRCRAPAPQSNRILRLPRLTQWHAEVRLPDGATVPVPTVTSSTQAGSI